MTQSTKHPNQVDIEVGARIRLRRKLVRMSQERLAAKIGVTFQQVQKYEKGANRVGGSRLHMIAEALGVTPAHFFGDTTSAGGETDKVMKFVLSTEGVSLFQAFTSIPDEAVRRRFIDLAKSLAA